MSAAARKIAAMPVRQNAARQNATRDRFIEMTARLMSRRGYAAVGLNEIVEKSGAPKGSLYHHFPRGKTELAAAAVAWSAERFAATVAEAIAASPSVAAGLRRTAETLAGWMETSGFRDGSPLTIVAVETGAHDETLRQACAAGYALTTGRIAAALEGEGCRPAEAADLADWAVAALEGAVTLARVRQSAEPLRRLGRLLQRSLS